MSIKTMKSFVKQFVATVTGDDVTAQAEKAFRQSESALKSQIASLSGDTINLEDKVEDTKSKLELAKINGGTVITDRENYISKLLTAKNNVTNAEKDLESHLKKIAFLQGTLEELSKEV